jgi:hypothetical protein
VPYVGTVFPYTYDVVDASGNPTNVATISLTITAPDQTSVVVVPTSSGTGHYTYNLALTQEGQYRLETVTTGPTTADGTSLNARRFVSLLSFQEAKAHLGTVQNDLQDDEIRAMSEAATVLIEAYVGPCVPRTVVERVRPRRGVITLAQIPILSVTSVTGVDTLLTWLPVDLDVDKTTGIIRPVNAAYFNYEQYTVSYVAGRGVLPATFIQAAKELLYHMWGPQRGQTGDTLEPSMADIGVLENAAAGAGLGFTPVLPARVRELLKPSRMPGFA